MTKMKRAKARKSWRRQTDQRQHIHMLSKSLVLFALFEVSSAHEADKAQSVYRSITLIINSVY